MCRHAYFSMSGQNLCTYYIDTTFTMKSNPIFLSFFAYFPVQYSFCSSTTKYSRPEDLFLHHHDPDTVHYSTCSSTTKYSTPHNLILHHHDTRYSRLQHLFFHHRQHLWRELSSCWSQHWEATSLHPPDTNTIIANTNTVISRIYSLPPPDTNTIMAMKKVDFS